MSIVDIFESLLEKEVQADVSRALTEDLGSGDISTEILPYDHQSQAEVICREDIILCGHMWFDAVFNELDNSTKINWNYADGDKINTDSILCSIEGYTRAILSAERTALNFLQTLSGTATTTYEYASSIKNYKTRILDTRKTIPGLRLAQKYAVKIGGGFNHRLGLHDAYLLKENHIKAAGSINKVVAMARELNRHKKLEVEVETIAEFKAALATRPEQILLDNFSLADIKEVVTLNQGQVKLEISGNVTLDNLTAYAKTGVDFISIGALTKNLKAVDLSLRIK